MKKLIVWKVSSFEIDNINNNIISIVTTNDYDDREQ